MASKSAVTGMAILYSLAHVFGCFAAACKPKSQPATTAPNGAPEVVGATCPTTCQGSGGTGIVVAMTNAAAEGHRCYDDLLRYEPKAQGQMDILVRIGVDGNICFVSVKRSELPPATTECVVAILQKTITPAPENGCVDVTVPLRFQPNATFGTFIYGERIVVAGTLIARKAVAGDDFAILALSKPVDAISPGPGSMNDAPTQRNQTELQVVFREPATARAFFGKHVRVSAEVTSQRSPVHQTPVVLVAAELIP